MFLKRTLGITTFPLYLVCLIFYFKTFSFLWLLNIVAVFILYSFLWWVSAHILSIFQLIDFYFEFVGKKRSFDLLPIEKKGLDFDFSENFTWLLFNYQANPLIRNNPQWAISSTPLLFFYALPLKDKLLSNSKAYLYAQGMFIIVSRTKEINKNSFEKFLLRHELEHINDTGLIFYRSVARHKTRFVIHLIVFCLFLNSWILVLCYFLFFLLCMGSLAIKPVAISECMADFGGLSSIKSPTDRLKTFTLLQKIITRQHGAAGFIGKRIYSLRYNMLNMFINFDNNFFHENNSDSKNIFFGFRFQGAEPETIISTIILLIGVSFSSLSPITFLITLGILFICFIALFFITTLISSNIFNIISKKILSRFKPDDFYLPFSFQENVARKSLSELLAKKDR